MIKTLFEVVCTTTVGQNKLYIAAVSRNQAAAITRRVLSSVQPKVISVLPVHEHAHARQS